MDESCKWTLAIQGQKDQFQDVLAFHGRQQHQKIKQNPQDEPIMHSSTSNVAGTFSFFCLKLILLDGLQIVELVTICVTITNILPT